MVPAGEEYGQHNTDQGYLGATIDKRSMHTVQ